MASTTDDQQFCLRWNNFQANITSQFETLRDDEDFTDVTIACDGQRLQAHKVVLSACSPYFKELFKTNPCAHPIIFMRDVEARHVMALMEFMYAGEVNVAQANLSSFLKTAESLKIRGLTDTAPTPTPSSIDETQSATSNKHKLNNNKPSSSQEGKKSSPPPVKRACRSETIGTESMNVNPFALQQQQQQQQQQKVPKVELADYSDGDGDVMSDLPGGMEIIPQLAKEDIPPSSMVRLKKRRSSSSSSSNHWLSSYDDTSAMRLCTKDGRNRVIKLGEGIEIYEEQLRSVKWSDYRKLTRGLATILFSPAELATCSVTGQRWSRAGSGERPVKPALDRSKVQAIISYVATRFPMIEISRIKQVLAYKCKENSTAFKMKAVRFYEDQHPLNQ